MTKSEKMSARRPRQWKGKRKRNIGATNDLSITFPQYHFSTVYGLIFRIFFASFSN